MDACPGGDLSPFALTSEKLTPEQVKFVGLEVTSVLAHLHLQHVLYRDLKPENLLLRGKANDTDVVLADFGFAKVTEGKNLQQVCGTPDCKKQTKKNATDLLMCLSAIST